MIIEDQEENLHEVTFIDPKLPGNKFLSITFTDVDHRRPMSKGGDSGRRLSNLRVMSRRRNRSFKRNRDGSMT